MGQTWKRRKGEDWVAMGSMEDIGGSGEVEDIVFADAVELTVEVGKVKVDEVEEIGSDRRESNIWVR